MNKITTSLLAGVALAAIAIAPASAKPIVAHNSFTNIDDTLPTFSFGPGNGTYTLTNASADFNPGGGGTSTSGTLSLSGKNFVAGSTYQYKTTTLTFTPTGGGTTFVETGASSIELFGDSVTFSALGTGGFSGSGHTGDRLNLSYATAPVPEASTVISFGALLALGGLAVLRRKSVARAS